MASIIPRERRRLQKKEARAIAAGRVRIQQESVSKLPFTTANSSDYGCRNAFFLAGSASRYAEVFRSSSRRRFHRDCLGL